eukprot:816822-Rhodomonas_salina.1
MERLPWVTPTLVQKLLDSDSRAWRAAAAEPQSFDPQLSNCPLKMRRVQQSVRHLALPRGLCGRTCTIVVEASERSALIRMGLAMHPLTVGLIARMLVSPLFED